MKFQNCILINFEQMHGRTHGQASYGQAWTSFLCPFNFSKVGGIAICPFNFSKVGGIKKH